MFAGIMNWKPIIQIRQEIMWHRGSYYFVIQQEGQDNSHRTKEIEPCDDN